MGQAVRFDSILVIRCDSIRMSCSVRRWILTEMRKKEGMACHLLCMKQVIHFIHFIQKGVAYKRHLSTGMRVVRYMSIPWLVERPYGRKLVGVRYYTS